MSVLFIAGGGIYAGCVACCPLMSHGEYADRTDGRTPDRCITLFARRDQRNKSNRFVDEICLRSLETVRYGRRPAADEGERLANDRI